jgi:hypothetical protein
MIPSLIAALLLVPVPVTVFDLGKNSEKYNGRIVRIEVVLEEFRPGPDRWHLAVTEDSFHLDVVGAGKPAAKDGDKVALTGRFRYKDRSFVPRVIHGATMEKIPFAVGPAELVKGAEKYHGRLVRVGATLKNFLAADDWHHAVKEAGAGRRVELFGTGKPDVRDGDRVAFTGTFEYAKAAFTPCAIRGCKVEKIPAAEKPGPKKP